MFEVPDPVFRSMHNAAMAWECAAATAQSAAEDRRLREMLMLAPHGRMRPRLFIDGNQWCALYGDNLQDGVAGFGDSPELAMAAFDRAWSEKLPTAKAGG